MMNNNRFSLSPKVLLSAAIVLLLCAAMVLACVQQYKRTAGMRFVREMGAGINLGNSFDVHNISSWKPNATLSEYEEAWGNPPTSLALLTQVRTAGFSTLRLPVSWGEHLLEDDRIDPMFLARVSEVVLQALDLGFYVILNTHHETWLSTLAEEEAAVTQRLCNIWAQLARQFSSCGQKLLFEGMNEPRTRDSELEWQGGTPEEWAVLNRLNAAFVDTVRADGGNNAQRYLLVGGYATDTVEQALLALELPRDDRLIVNVHNYSPYSFALADEGTDDWSRENEKDTKKLDAMFALLNDLFIRKKIPVIITEFGCADRDNLQARLDWANYFTGAARVLGIPCVWWDEGGRMALLNRFEGEWRHPELVEVLLENALLPSPQA